MKDQEHLHALELDESARRAIQLGMELKGWGNAEMAKALGVAPSAVWAILKPGAEPMSLRTLQRYSDALERRFVVLDAQAVASVSGSWAELTKQGRWILELEDVASRVNHPRQNEVVFASVLARKHLHAFACVVARALDLPQPPPLEEPS